MKVFEIIPSLHQAGAETMCATLSSQMKKHGIDVIVVSFYNYQSPLSRVLEDNGVPIIYLNKKRGIDFSIFVDLYKLIQNFKPDVIHMHLYSIRYVVPIAFLVKKRVLIHTVHNVVSVRDNFIFRHLYGFFYKHLNVIPVAISKDVKKAIHSVYKMPLENIPLIYNGINLEKCKIKLSYEQHKDLRYIHVGRFDDVKNHDMLIDAFLQVHNTLQDSLLYLIGDGELKEKIQKKVTELNLSDSVLFLGTTDNVFDKLYNADVFVFPSKCEGLGLALMEAMATGLPTVATNVGGIPELIENEKDGLLSEVDPNDIAEKMLRLNNKDLLKSLEVAANHGTSARKKIWDIYSSSKMTENYICLFQKELRKC